MTIDVRVDERTLHEVYLPAFKAAVQEGGAWSVMAAYNKLNGLHATENPWLLTDVLKRNWGFKGLVMSDWTAVRSTAPTLQAGLDLEMPTGAFLDAEKVRKALSDGLVSESTIDESVRRTLRAMVSIGLLDHDPLAGGALDTPEHRKVALDAARAGIVLVKNEGHLLPLDPSRLRSVAVIGPNAAFARLGGGGSAKVVPFRAVSPLEGVKARLGAAVRVEHAAGIVALEDTTPIPADHLRSPEGDMPGLLGEYYTNVELSGTPEVKRVDPVVNFRWETRAPLEGFPDDRFSIRWTGRLVPPASGRYVLSLSSNDGGRLYLDDERIVDLWADHATLTAAAVVELRAGEPRRLRIEYYESRGNADVVLGWRLQENETPEPAIAAASRADVALVFAGLSPALEAEAVDRADLQLPPGQDELIAAVAAANPRTVVVLNGGGPILMDRWLDRVPSLVQAFYLGQEGGTALAEVLFGDVSPSGKLPLTLPRRWEDSSAYGHYPGQSGEVRYEEGVFVGYRHFDQKGLEPLFPFGHGLSYARLVYSNLSLSPRRLSKGESLAVEFDLQNTGSRDAADVPQVYVHALGSSVPRPVRELKGFQRTLLRAGEKQRVRISLPADAFSRYEPGRGWVTDRGSFEIEVGASSRDLRLRGSVEVARGR
jgi:beta-glucosidase